MRPKDIIAFIKRDFLIWKSYRLLFGLNIIGVFVPVFIFYFISKLFNIDPRYLKDYRGEYFPFVFIGLVIQGYLLTALYGFSLKIRSEQLLGTMEKLISTTITPTSLILSLISWEFFIGGLNILIYFIIGFFLFNLHFEPTGILPALVILVLGITSLSSLGIISASIILYFKRGDPIGWLVVTLSIFLGGVYFPSEILPSILQKISNFIPLTYILKALRLSLLKGFSLGSLMNYIVTLILFQIILLPISLFIFKTALRKTLRDGMQIY